MYHLSALGEDAWFCIRLLNARQFAASNRARLAGFTERDRGPAMTAVAVFPVKRTMTSHSLER